MIIPDKLTITFCLNGECKPEFFRPVLAIIPSVSYENSFTTANIWDIPHTITLACVVQATEGSDYWIELKGLNLSPIYPVAYLDLPTPNTDFLKALYELRGLSYYLNPHNPMEQK
jgi:hypothetical protein